MPPPMSKTMRRRAPAAIMLREFNKEADRRQYLLETETSARRRRRRRRREAQRWKARRLKLIQKV